MIVPGDLPFASSASVSRADRLARPPRRTDCRADRGCRSTANASAWHRAGRASGCRLNVGLVAMQGPEQKVGRLTLRICRNVRGEGLQPSRARARHHRPHLNRRRRRSFGRALNIWYDADIDALQRTASRPIPRGHVTPDEALTFRTILRRLLARAITTSASYSASGRKSAGDGRPSSWAPSRRDVPTCRQHERTAARRSRSAAACPVASRSAQSHAPRPVAFGDRARARARPSSGGPRCPSRK